MAGEIDYVASYTIHARDGDIYMDCQSMEGGHPEAKGGFSRNPITGKVTRRGGMPEPSSITVEVEIDTFVWSVQQRIKDATDKARFTAVKQFLDADRVPIGDPDRYTGIHGTSDFGKFDINGGDNTSLLKIESGVDGR